MLGSGVHRGEPGVGSALLGAQSLARRQWKGGKEGGMTSKCHLTAGGRASTYEFVGDKHLVRSRDLVT